MLLVQFLISSAVIVFAGIRLTRSADLLSDRLGLGKVWVGVLLLGMITSLPEAVASLTSVIALHAPDLAVGNIMGSNAFNPLLIVAMDAAYSSGAITDRITFSRAHVIPAVFAVALTVMAAGEILLGARHALPQIGPVSAGSVAIVLVFFWGLKYLAGEDKPQAQDARKTPGKTVTLTAIGGQLLLSAVLVVGSAMWLAKVCDGIAARTGWGETFVGALVLALVTSLPELVVTVSAVRMGSLDLALGNIFGSNMTNIFFIPLCDVFYRGNLLAHVEKSNVVMAAVSVALTGVVLMGIRTQNKRRFFGVGWDSLVLVVIFVAGAAVLYTIR